MKQKLLLLLTTTLIIFIITELTFTISVDTDLDGNMSLNYVHLKPFQLPVIETQNKIEKLLQNKLPDSLLQNYKDKAFKREYFNVRLIPDSILGWAPNPYYKSDDELYIYNNAGIRTDDLLVKYEKKEKLRIAIFGDSYAHGDEVNFRNTIGYYLESELQKANIDVEVINFAVSGYGMDQAYLRYRKIKDEYNPDIIILGVQFENVKRHINLLRPFYYHTTDIPYSKPRFIIQTRELQLISNPIKNIENTEEIISKFEDWELANFEGFYSSDNYNPSFIYYCKTISFIGSALSQIFSEIDYYTPNSESYKITLNIFENFKSSVVDDGKLFIPVHLPVKNDFDFITKKFLHFNYDKNFIYDDLFNTLKLNYKFVEPYNLMMQWSSKNSINRLFAERHYSSISNKIIAQNIFEFMTKENPTLFNNTDKGN
jgi:hypothetical protein